MVPGEKKPPIHEGVSVPSEMKGVQACWAPVDEVAQEDELAVCAMRRKRRQMAQQASECVSPAMHVAHDEHLIGG